MTFSTGSQHSGTRSHVSEELRKKRPRRNDQRTIRTGETIRRDRLGVDHHLEGVGGPELPLKVSERTLELS